MLLLFLKVFVPSCVTLVSISILYQNQSEMSFNIANVINFTLALLDIVEKVFVFR